jgi:hypothetical protein
MKLITVGILLMSLSTFAQKDTTFARAFTLTTTAIFPDPSASDFHEIRQNVTLRLMGSLFTITRLGNSTLLGSSDTLNVRKVSYNKTKGILKITTTQGWEIDAFDTSVFIMHPKVGKKYQMELMEAKDEIPVKGKVTLIRPL